MQGWRNVPGVPIFTLNQKQPLTGSDEENHSSLRRKHTPEGEKRGISFTLNLSYALLVEVDKDFDAGGLGLSFYAFDRAYASGARGGRGEVAGVGQGKNRGGMARAHFFGGALFSPSGVVGFDKPFQGW
jgi:hypothetical protein